MNPKSRKIAEGVRAQNASRAIRDFILDASEDELREAFAAEGESVEAAAARSKAVIDRAFERVSSRDTKSPRDLQETFDLHRGLGALIQLLRRRERLSDVDLAEKAGVGVEEIRKIESELTFIPEPRTIYQLEHFFKLPRRSLVLLSGSMRAQKADLREAAVRFAAHSKSIGKLTRDEKALLNQFVAFLKDKAKEL